MPRRAGLKSALEGGGTSLSPALITVDDDSQMDTYTLPTTRTLTNNDGTYPAAFTASVSGPPDVGANLRVEGASSYGNRLTPGANEGLEFTRIGLLTHSGTVTQSGTTVTGTNTAFTFYAAVGGRISISGGPWRNIVEVVDDNELTVDTSDTVGSSSFELETPGSAIIRLSSGETIVITILDHVVAEIATSYANDYPSGHAIAALPGTSVVIPLSGTIEYLRNGLTTSLPGQPSFTSTSKEQYQGLRFDFVNPVRMTEFTYYQNNSGGHGPWRIWGSNTLYATGAAAAAAATDLTGAFTLTSTGLGSPLVQAVNAGPAETYRYYYLLADDTSNYDTGPVPREFTFKIGP